MIVNATNHSRKNLVELARQKKIEIKATKHGASSDVELACLKAIFTYEEIQSIEKKRKFYANRTWQSIKNNGIIEAAERAVTRSSVTMGYEALLKHGLEEHAFESIILCWPKYFSQKAIDISRQRISEWKKPNSQT